MLKNNNILCLFYNKAETGSELNLLRRNYKKFETNLVHLPLRACFKGIQQLLGRHRLEVISLKLIRYLTYS